MADPLSITASVITLIQVSVQVTVLIKQFHDDASIVDATLIGLLGDVEGFKRVLESMRETIDQSDIKLNLPSTGHVGSHWKNLARSLNDGTDVLQKMHALLDGINKKTPLLDAPRKLLRLKSASTQISRYREQIQSSHTALQLSLSTIILWNQVALQKSTEALPDKIVPTLNKLYEEFRIFGSLLNAKIDKLKSAVADSEDSNKYELNYMSNLRECVRSAADVVSTASTTLNTDSSDNNSVKYGSDFGDVFIKDASEPMLRWFAANTVHEYEDVAAPLPAPSDARSIHSLAEDLSDAESDTEGEMIRSLFEQGIEHKDQGDLTGAIHSFQNCLEILSSHASYASLTAAQSLKVCGVSKSELLEHLTDSHCLLGSWGKARSTMAEKLLIMERQVGKKDAIYLENTMKLAELMVMNEDYAKAHLQARQPLRGFKKLGENGHTGYQNCLAFLIKISELQRKSLEKEGYKALLARHAKAMQRAVPGFQSMLLYPSVSQLQHLSAPSLESWSNTGTRVPKKAQNALLQSRTVERKLLFGDHDPPRSLFPRRPSVKGIGTTGRRAGKKQGLFYSEPEDFQSSESEDNIGIYPSKKRRQIHNPPGKHYKATSQDSDQDVSSSETEDSQSSSSEDEDEGYRTPQKYQVHDHTYKHWKATSQDSELLSMRNVGINNTGVEWDGWVEWPSSQLYGSDYPGEAIESWYNFTMATREEKIKLKRAEELKTINFLEAYCEMRGEKPRYSNYKNSWGFTCTVKISATQQSTVSGYRTYHQAQNAAAVKAYMTYISASDVDVVMDTLGRPDPSSDKEVFVPIDKEVYIPIHIEENVACRPLGSATTVPQITFTENTHDVEITRNGWNLQRSIFSSSGQTVSRGRMGKLLAKSYAAFKSTKTHPYAVGNLPVILPGSLLPSQNSTGRSSPDVFHTCPVCDEELPSSSRTAWTMHLTSCITASDRGSMFSRVVQCPICQQHLSKMTKEACVDHIGSCTGEGVPATHAELQRNDEEWLPIELSGEAGRTSRSSF